MEYCNDNEKRVKNFWVYCKEVFEKRILLNQILIKRYAIRSLKKL